MYEVLNQDPGDNTSAWDGQVDGQWKEGVYNVRVEAEAADGTIGVFDGKVCNYRCRDLETSGTISSEGCQFPVQTTNGQYDPTIPSFEDECF